MAEKDAKPKKQSTIKQIIQIYKYTAKEDKALPWLEAGAFLLPVVVMIIIGLIAKWTWLTWIFTMITAIMLGMLLATMMLTAARMQSATSRLTASLVPPSAC